MLKRIAVIAAFTGAGQLFSIFTLKLISTHVSSESLASTGQADSLFQFLINLIAFGLQPVAMRNIITSENWRKEYEVFQSARLTLGLILLTFSATVFWEPVNIMFMIAPLLALSGDYALYALGKPVTGAAISFIRVILPYSLLILTSTLNPGWLLYSYVCGTFIAIVFTNIIMSFVLKTPLFFAPRFKNLKLYIQSLPLGMVSLSLYFLGLGILLILPYFYKNESTIVIFVGLKFYVIFKGLLRIIHQAFLKEMIKSETCILVDRLSSLAGLCFACFVSVYPVSFVSFFFGKNYINNTDFFIVLGIAGLVYSLFSSVTTKALLEKKDKPYAINAVISAIITLILSVVLSFWGSKPVYAAISILTGEIIFTLSMIHLLNYSESLPLRIKSFLKASAFISVPIFIRVGIGESQFSFFLAFIAFSVLLFLFNFKSFSNYVK
jgi:O-antigen/teichoic acid export membrane protein